MKTRVFKIGVLIGICLCIALGAYLFMDWKNQTILVLNDWNVSPSQEFYLVGTKPITLEREDTLLVIVFDPDWNKLDYGLWQLLSDYNVSYFWEKGSIVVRLKTLEKERADTVIEKLRIFKGIHYILPAYGKDTSHLQIFTGRIAIEFHKGVSEEAKKKVLEPFILDSINEYGRYYVREKERKQPLFATMQAIVTSHPEIVEVAYPDFMLIENKK